MMRAVNITKRTPVYCHLNKNLPRQRKRDVVKLLVYCTCIKLFYVTLLFKDRAF